MGVGCRNGEAAGDGAGAGAGADIDIDCEAGAIIGGDDGADVIGPNKEDIIPEAVGAL